MRPLSLTAFGLSDKFILKKAVFSREDVSDNASVSNCSACRKERELHLNQSRFNESRDRRCTEIVRPSTYKVKQSQDLTGFENQPSTDFGSPFLYPILQPTSDKAIPENMTFSYNDGASSFGSSINYLIEDEDKYNLNKKNKRFNNNRKRHWTDGQIKSKINYASDGSPPEKTLVRSISTG
eukprot:UN27672